MLFNTIYHEFIQEHIEGYSPGSWLYQIFNPMSARYEQLSSPMSLQWLGITVGLDLKQHPRFQNHHYCPKSSSSLGFIPSRKKACLSCYFRIRFVHITFEDHIYSQNQKFFFSKKPQVLSIILLVQSIKFLRFLKKKIKIGD